MGEFYCPACGSHDVEFEEEGRMECLNCGFKGTNFPEEHLLIEGEDDETEDMPTKKVKKQRVYNDEDEEIIEKPAKKPKAKARKAGKAKKAKSTKAKGKRR